MDFPMARHAGEFNAANVPESQHLRDGVDGPSMTQQGLSLPINGSHGGLVKLFFIVSVEFCSGEIWADGMARTSNEVPQPTQIPARYQRKVLKENKRAVYPRGDNGRAFPSADSCFSDFPVAARENPLPKAVPAC
jgi:hypothetical protein